MIDSLDHIQLAMPPGQEETARMFFRDTLGMSDNEKPEALASRGGCWFRAGSVIVHLGVEEDFISQKKAHPAFCVTDINRLADTLGKEGFALAWDEALPGRKRFYTTDPFGNRIEFIQRGDGFRDR